MNNNTGFTAKKYAHVAGSFGGKEIVKNLQMLDQNSDLGPEWETFDLFSKFVVKTQKSGAKMVQ